MDIDTKKTPKLIVCGGCNAKMGPTDLQNLLTDLGAAKDKNLLVGYGSSDDAAVYKITEDKAVIQTLDFFPSMVSDPYLFGEIAATNALSDVFAMGGDVLLALNIVCFPEDGDRNVLKAILQGGQKKIVEAGGVLAGGHSIHDRLPKYGLAVTGQIDPHKIIKNNQVKAGDVLLLTKKLGVGIVTSSYAAEATTKAAFDTAVESMTTLNKRASEIMRKYNVSSCTDITGFGLAGHLSEMLGGSNGAYQAQINSETLPIIPEAYECAEQSFVTAGGQRNRKFLQGKIKFSFDDYALEEIMFDPQTSGGLLMSVPAEVADNLFNELHAANVVVSKIGEITKKQSKQAAEIVIN